MYGANISLCTNQELRLIKCPPESKLLKRLEKKNQSLNKKHLNSLNKYNTRQKECKLQNS